MPDQPKDAAKDVASAIKESLPEAPKGIPNPLQNFFGKRGSAFLRKSYFPADLSHRERQPHGKSGFNDILLRDSRDERRYALSSKGTKIPVRIHQTIQ